MYLCVAPFDRDGKVHPLKVIVPAKTKIDTAHLSHDNKFECLLFNECDPMDHFDLDKRCTYLGITAAEHAAQCKV
jgi:hypothetical protein